MGQENRRANQAHNRCNRLNHRTNPLRPCTHRTTAALHSQKDSVAETTDPGRVMICCNRLSETGTGQGWSMGDRHNEARKPPGDHDKPKATTPVATIDSPRRRAPHFRRVRVAISLRLGAEVGRIKESGHAAST